MSTVTVTILKYDPPINPSKVFLQLTFAGSYTSGTPDVLNLYPATWLDPSGQGVLGYPTQPPKVNPSVKSVNYTGTSGSGAGEIGSSVQIIPGATLDAYGVQQFLASGTELSSGALPTGITSGSVTIEVDF